MFRALATVAIFVFLQVVLPTWLASWRGRKGGDSERWRCVAFKLWLTIVITPIAVAHFASPAFVAELLPPFVPFPYAVSYASGLLELLLVGGIWTRYEHFAGLALIVLLALLLPFNIYGWFVPGLERVNPNFETRPYYLVSRIPMQFIWMYLAYVATHQDWRAGILPSRLSETTSQA